MFTLHEINLFNAYSSEDLIAQEYITLVHLVAVVFFGFVRNATRTRMACKVLSDEESLIILSAARLALNNFRIKIPSRRLASSSDEDRFNSERRKMDH